MSVTTGPVGGVDVSVGPVEDEPELDEDPLELLGEVELTHEDDGGGSLLVNGGVGESVGVGGVVLGTSVGDGASVPDHVGVPDQLGVAVQDQLGWPVPEGCVGDGWVLVFDGVGEGCVLVFDGVGEGCVLVFDGVGDGCVLVFDGVGVVRVDVVGGFTGVVDGTTGVVVSTGGVVDAGVVDPVSVAPGEVDVPDPPGWDSPGGAVGATVEVGVVDCVPVPVPGPPPVPVPPPPPVPPPFPLEPPPMTLAGTEPTPMFSPTRSIMDQATVAERITMASQTAASPAGLRSAAKRAMVDILLSRYWVNVNHE